MRRGGGCGCDDKCVRQGEGRWKGERGWTTPTWDAITGRWVPINGKGKGKGVGGKAKGGGGKAKGGGGNAKGGGPGAGIVERSQ